MTPQSSAPLGIAAPSSNANTQEKAEADVLEVQSQPQLHRGFENSLDM